MSSTMHDDIPFDIQTEIIKRIPDVKSLIRFRSVSKPWKSLIDSSEFISAYKSPNPRFLLKYHIPGCGGSYESVADDDSFPSQHPLAFPKSAGRLVGISQGLLCFYKFRKEHNPIKYEIVIWNPSIRKSVTYDFPEYSYNNFKVLGFGVCPRTKDPKLVNITDSEIFTLSSRTWRRIQSINVPNFNAISFHNRVVIDIDGILYWHGIADYYSSNRVKYNRIITFDLTSEEFGEVCLPDKLSTNFSDNFKISKLNESLVVLERGGACESHVWIMDNGASNLIKKRYTIEAPFPFSIRGFRMNGEAMIETKKDKKRILKVYDPCTGNINKGDLMIDRRLSYRCSYRETLLLLNQSDSIID